MRRAHSFLALALLLLGADGARAEERPPEIVAVLNQSNPMASMSLQQLRLLYGLYKRSWPGGVRVQLVLPPSGSAAMDFLVSRVFRHGDERQIDAFYLQAVFAQSIPARPPQLPPRSAIGTVRAEPGAIALVERSEIRDQSGIRVLPLTDE